MVTLELIKLKVLGSKMPRLLKIIQETMVDIISNIRTPIWVLVTEDVLRLVFKTQFMLSKIFKRPESK